MKVMTDLLPLTYPLRNKGLIAGKPMANKHLDKADLDPEGGGLGGRGNVNQSL